MTGFGLVHYVNNVSSSETEKKKSLFIHEAGLFIQTAVLYALCNMLKYLGNPTSGILWGC